MKFLKVTPQTTLHWMLPKILLWVLLLPGGINSCFCQKINNSWSLVWQEEFNQPGLPDINKWNYDTVGNESGWGNREAQWYTSHNAENAEVRNGLLHIRAHKKPLNGKQYTSARLTTKNKGDWQYGKIEVRAKLPKGIGSWPAIWMLPTQSDKLKWPDCGEIDIMEHIGSQADSVLSTIHTKSYNHLKGTQKGASMFLPQSRDSFFVYGLEWSANEMVFMVNEKVVYRYSKTEISQDTWPFDKPFHLILNLAIGGNFGGKKGIENSSFPQIFQIDYVRVYQKKEGEIIQHPQGSENNQQETGKRKEYSPEGQKILLYGSSNGITSIHTATGYVATGWKPAKYYTGWGMQLSENDPQITNELEYVINISKPGTYHVFMLGSKMRNAPDTNLLQISLKQKDGSIIKRGQVLLSQINAPYWMGTSQQYEPEISWQIKDTGIYQVNVSAIRGQQLYLEKIVLTTNETYPTGTGPELTLAKSEDTTNFDASKIRSILPPAWAFGVLYGGYTNQETTLQTIDSLRMGSFPIDAYWIDSWFWNFTEQGRGPKGYVDFKGDREAFPNLKEMWQKMQNQKVKGGIWIWDCVFRENNEAVYDSFLRKNFFTNSFISSDRWHNRTGHTITGNIDFENPEGVAYWKQQLAPFFEAGLDFLKLDRSSEIPFTKAAFTATQEMGKETKGRGFTLTHLHSTYDPRHKLYPTKWTGDAKIAWTQPDYPNNSIYAMGAMKENVAMIADPKRTTYEIPFLTHDAGGYDYFGSTEQSNELYMRWIQFASLNSIMTLFSQYTNPTRNLPHRYPDYVQENFKKYTHLRMRLFPYLYTQALNTHLTGTKMVQGNGIDVDQFLLGEALLVAPVVTKGATTREVNFPPGTWYDIDTDETFTGGKNIMVNAPAEKLPLFIKKGSILPKRDYAPAIELGTNAHITLDIYPDTSGYFTLIEDDGTSNDYLEEGFSKTDISMKQLRKQLNISIGKTIGKYHPPFTERKWSLQIHKMKARPKNIRMNGKPVAFLYESKKQLVKITYSGKINEMVLIEIQ